MALRTFITTAVIVLLVGCTEQPPEIISCIDKPICEKPEDACACAIQCLPNEPPPPPPQKPVALIILDLSGSMNEAVSKNSATKKIQDAKRVVERIIDHPRAKSINLGFIGFGHITSGCQNNVQTLLDPKNNNQKSILTTLSNVNPKGDTPLAEAIASAGNILLSKQRQGHKQLKLVLVSDGEETCKGDPVNEVKKLKQQGLDFVFHAIGYGTDKATNDTLNQLAFLGNGKLFKPFDYRELRNDISKAVYGVGNISVTELEDRNAEGWKLYENNEPFLQVNRTTEVRERLWLTRPAIVGSYQFCFYTKNRETGIEKAYAKRIKINANELTTVNSVELIDSLREI